MEEGILQKISFASLLLGKDFLRGGKNLLQRKNKEKISIDSTDLVVDVSEVFRMFQNSVNQELFQLKAIFIEQGKFFLKKHKELMSTLDKGGFLQLNQPSSLGANSKQKFFLQQMHKFLSPSSLFFHFSQPTTFLLLIYPSKMKKSEIFSINANFLIQLFKYQNKNNIQYSYSEDLHSFFHQQSISHLFSLQKLFVIFLFNKCFSFLLKHHNIYLKQMLCSTKFKLIILVISFTLAHFSHQIQKLFQAPLIPYPFPLAYMIITQPTQLRAAVLVRGATLYHHIGFIPDGATVSKTNPSLYRTDNYTYPAVVNTGMAMSYVYIVSAPGLVAVQISLFGNGTKKFQNYFIAAQFDRGYAFIQFRIDQGCKVKFQSQLLGTFNIFDRKEDAFSEFVGQYTFGSSQIMLSHAGKYYLRVNYSPTLDLKDASIYNIDIKTFSDSNCQNSCLYPLFQAVLPTTKNLCICSGFGQIYDPQIKECIFCSANYSAICTDIRAQTCTNQLKQGSQQCDNGGEIGCTYCKIQAGYTCSQNQQGKSSCSLTFSAPDTLKLDDSSSQTRNSIIIGTTVGIGGGVVVIGVALYFILKWLKAKALVVEASNNSSAVLV